MRELPEVSITEIQPVGECMQDISIGLLSHDQILNCAPSLSDLGGGRFWGDLGPLDLGVHGDLFYPPFRALLFVWKSCMAPDFS